MNQQAEGRRYLSVGNKIVVNRQFIGLGHTLEAKKRERKEVEHQEKELRNKVVKLEQSQSKAFKEVEKKYQQLQNIYKIRTRKQTQQQHRDKLKRDKEDEIRMLKVQWKEERDRNAAKKKESIAGLLEANRRLYQTQKTSKRQEQTKRNQILKKHLDENISKTLEIKNNKESGVHEVIQFKRTKNKESIDLYRTKIDEEDHKRRQKMVRIKSLSMQHQLKSLEIQKNQQARVDIQEAISKAHDVSLDELERLMVSRRPFKVLPSTAIRTERRRLGPRSVSKATSRKISQESLRDMQELYYNPERKQTRQANQAKPQEQQVYQSKSALFGKSQIEDTIRIIEKLQAQQSTQLSSNPKPRQSKGESRKKQIKRDPVS